MRFDRINICSFRIISRDDGTAVPHHPMKRPAGNVGVQEKKPLKTSSTEELSILEVSVARECVTQWSRQGLEPTERQNDDERQHCKKNHDCFPALGQGQPDKYLQYNNDVGRAVIAEGQCTGSQQQKYDRTRSCTRLLAFPAGNR